MEATMMDTATNTLTMSDARTRYYEVNGFGTDGGDSLKWVPIKALGMTFYIPNTEGRRRAVRIHDLHHVCTGYQTDLRGEAEIAAWELASGCWQWPAALVLNSLAMGVGVAIAPRRTARAWARGRQSGNLYGARQGVDHLLPRTVGEIRAELRVDRPAPRARLRDALAVAAVGLPALAVLSAPLAAAALLVRALI